MLRHTFAFQLPDIFWGCGAVQTVIKALIKLLKDLFSSPTLATTTQRLSLGEVPPELLEVLPVDRQILQGEKWWNFGLVLAHIFLQSLVSSTLKKLTHLLLSCVVLMVVEI